MDRASTPEPSDAGNAAARMQALQARITSLERALRASEEKLSLEQLKLQQTESALWQLSVVFGNVPLAAMLLDPDGVVTDLNHEAERLLGQRREKLLGRHLVELVGADRRAECERLIARCRAGETVRGVEHELWGQSARSESAALFPLRDQHGQVLGMALAEDVREIKDAREMLVDVNRELRLLASVDGLTEVPNRRSYEVALEREFRRAQREEFPFTVAMIDVDHFKAFNDRLGHVAGDQCLRTIARTLSDVVHRPGDLVARYGGEEFVAILGGTGPDGAPLLGERFRSSIRDLALPHPTSPTAPVVTVSVGIACCADARRTSVEALQAAADAALYAAKAAGRDRVVVRVLGDSDAESAAPLGG